jgi:quercetin dioxygenase-like cupin family protein
VVSTSSTSRRSEAPTCGGALVVDHPGGTTMAPSPLTDRALPAQRAVEFGPDPGRLGLDDLPARDLDTDELRDLAATVASDPDTWAHLVGFDDEERVYASLHRDDHVEVWLLCWTPHNDTGWHDHDISSGAVAVVAGELVENNLTVGAGALETRIRAGRAFAFGPEHIHRLNGALPGSVSVHAYSPPLRRMGQYAVSDAGVLRRVSVSASDELRPLD